jgi:hypothetical protein
MTFQDGEPLHLWVGRYFFGNLIIKHGDVGGRLPAKGWTMGFRKSPSR